MYEPASKRGSPANTCLPALPIPLRKGMFTATAVMFESVAVLPQRMLGSGALSAVGSQPSCDR